jgi:predicted nucleic-acid-binding Zn-ribbon protein
MASFIGIRKEFRRYIGPRLRNLVQQISKNHRVALANCQHCGTSEYLQAAHVVGRDRNQIIDILLEKFTHNDIVTIDIGEFEKSFKIEHAPLENSILILCRACHTKYDSNPKQASVRERIDGASADEKSSEIARSEVYLPISLVPSDASEFKRQFLESGIAEIITTYCNGRLERKIWRALNFSASSNLIGNLRSRPDFRAGNWRAKGIASVTVRVLDNT